MIVAVNKMDITEPPYSRTRFEEIKKEVLSQMKKAGYNPMTIACIPISGFHGDNMIEPTENIAWYREWSFKRKVLKTDGEEEWRVFAGKTLKDAIDNMAPPRRPTDKPLRLPLQDVYKIGGMVLLFEGD